ncbi:MAG TPA: HEAT repeat domain-containing protein, partial [Candidatus Udaeobacter sp.]|nr:HEAT repeat domain-containing protein [Candidatus Udaeobacter sp.]
MDSPSRSNGSRTRPAADGASRPPGRSRVAGRLDRVITTVLAGEPSAVLNVTGPELLADAGSVAATIGRSLDRQDVGVTGHWLLHELLRRSMVYDDLVNALQSPNSLTRAGAARICGAARLTDSVVWLGDLLEDPSPAVREAAVRGLAQHGGRRAVDILVASGDRVRLHRLAIALAKAASDFDIEALMRQPVSEHAAVATVMACGLRHDVLRISPLLGIAHDRRWPM